MTGSGRSDVDPVMGSTVEPFDGGSSPGQGSGTADDGVAAAIEQMWPAASERFRQRVAMIEDYVAEVVSGRADSASVGDAGDAAHMLAGTLGLFGLTNGSVHARELDERFEEHPDYHPETVNRLAYLAKRLRSDIEHRSLGRVGEGLSPPIIADPGGHGR